MGGCKTRVSVCMSMSDETSQQLTHCVAHCHYKKCAKMQLILLCFQDICELL